jgi:hypothetical protein
LILAGWAARDTKERKLEVDPEGHIELPKEGARRFLCGLGRLVVAEHVPEDEAGWKTPEWNLTMAFVWKLSAETTFDVMRYGAFRLGPRYRWNDDKRFPQELIDMLMPGAVRTIPGMVIVLMLLGFVLAIGPFDWWLLGRLRARRFTWLLFPAVAAGVTVLAVRVARHYMGGATIERALVVTDLGPDGRVVRETRCEIVVPAVSGDSEKEINHALNHPMLARNFREDSVLPNHTMEGTFPSRYRIVRPLRQWQPSVIRLTSIGPGEDRSGIHWDEVRAAVPFISDEIATKLTVGSGCAVGYATRDQVFQVSTKALPNDGLRWLIRRGKSDFSEEKVHRSPGYGGHLPEVFGFSTVHPEVTSDPLDDVVIFAWRIEGPTLNVWRRLYLR